MVYTRPNDKEASDMFKDSASDRCGSGYTWCQCNIDHYCPQSQYFDDHEPGSMPEASNTVMHHYDCDSVGSLTLDGRTYVDECPGCSLALKRYEDWIWNNRNHIRDYLKLRVDQEKRWAEYEHTKNILTGITPVPMTGYEGEWHG